MLRLFAVGQVGSSPVGAYPAVPNLSERLDELVATYADISHHYSRVRHADK